MHYADLFALYHGSASSRKFFLSQPVELQLAWSEYRAYIHTAEELHQWADAMKNGYRPTEK